MFGYLQLDVSEPWLQEVALFLCLYCFKLTKFLLSHTTFWGPFTIFCLMAKLPVRQTSATGKDRGIFMMGLSPNKDSNQRRLKTVLIVQL